MRGALELSIEHLCAKRCTAAGGARTRGRPGALGLATEKLRLSGARRQTAKASGRPRHRRADKAWR
jgi:hypothetical protein